MQKREKKCLSGGIRMNQKNIGKGGGKKKESSLL